MGRRRTRGCRVCGFPHLFETQAQGRLWGTLQMSPTMQCMESALLPLQGSFVRQFAQEWIEAWNSHDLERILDHYDDEVVLVSPVALSVLGNGRVQGKAALPRDRGVSPLTLRFVRSVVGHGDGRGCLQQQCSQQQGGGGHAVERRGQSYACVGELRSVELLDVLVPHTSKSGLCGPPTRR
jgi:ketosteroid isomerase-like protein